MRASLNDIEVEFTFALFFDDSLDEVVPDVDKPDKVNEDVDVVSEAVTSVVSLPSSFQTRVVQNLTAHPESNSVQRLAISEVTERGQFSLKATDEFFYVDLLKKLLIDEP